MRRFVAVLAAAALVHVPAAAAWSWPVEGPVLRPFAFGNDPYAAGQHRGIDIGAPDGTTVRAATGGTVSFAGTVPTGGRTVTVRTTGGLSVTYLELGVTHVARGAEVAEGDQIGTIGPAGHVHFGVRITADPQGYLDPLLFLPTRVAPAPEAQPDSVAEPSPAAEPIPAADPPRAIEQPAPDPVVSEPEASPVLDSPAEAVPSVPVIEPASSETSVAEPDPVAQPSAALEPVPLPDPSPTVAPAPLEPAASEPGVEPAAEPEASPVADSPATVGPAPDVELAPAKESLAEPEPASEPAPVLEPAPVAEAVPANARVRVEPAASEPEAQPVADSPASVAPVSVVELAPVEQGLAEAHSVPEPSPAAVADAAPALAPAPFEPPASEQEPQPVADSSPTVGPAPFVELAPAEPGVAEPEPAAEPAPALEPVHNGPATVASTAGTVLAEPEVRSAGNSTPAVAVAMPPVEAAPAENPAVQHDRPGAVAVVAVAGPEWTAEAVATKSASATAVEPVAVELVAVVEKALGASDPASSTPSTQTVVPVASDPASAQLAPEASPRPPAVTATFVESTLAALLPTAVVDAQRPGVPVIDRGPAPPVLESVVDSGSTRDVSKPRSSTLAHVRPPNVATAALPEKPVKWVSAGLPGRERTPEPAVATPTPRPKADAEIIHLAPVALAGLLVLGLLILARTTAVRRRDRSAATTEASPVVESATCPLIRTRAPRLLHGCARVPDPGWVVPAVCSRRLAPARPLPGTRRRVPASTRA